MRAWIQDTYGDASVLRLAEVPEPVVRDDEVLVAPVAVGVNNGDARIMRGEPLLVRLFFGLRRPKQQSRGIDIAGTVVSPSNGFSRGDRVVGEGAGGGFGELVAIPANRLARVPAEVDLITAAVVPVAAGTAWAALEAAGITPDTEHGRRVLVLGASGGVASYTIGLALGRGAIVTAICRPSAVETVRSWGAQDVRARGNNDPLGADERWDAIIDIAGDRRLTDLRTRLTPGGRAALVTGNGSRLLGPVGRIIRSLFVSRKAARLVPVSQKANRDVLAALLALVATGDLVPRITSIVDFAEVPAALAAVASGEVIGKSVVRVRPDAVQKSDK
ncbi:NAD(P)-dependent alcohol dehydrogenase [Microbacterium sp. NC79]|uniref:NAD(P)-dependent alcohol dehydrogenase n=1 Tax=Microbacterium sp. NC79 TaxID=2851009 RepID=UPI001C2B8428|nr:NAD(P)-dependent alcohol dehydrogenase [Microbacterium sp. NC79]MBV0893847.1 NAD(P)-dependent alcohol dehydrogenase [Microbacterium sp. NC79]